ncbi:site-specific integrase [uncultured Tateyamaria sp.]|uniref:site-specific integrase n=1 Tax=uncultured Tateyamaria sp. TaxID=455651 RepID=UPI00260F2299|nr:site-specific integrase [uncultured Tateyamaria sp.]
MKTTTLFTPLLLASIMPRKKEYVLFDAQCDGLALRVQPSGTKSWICWHRTGGKTRRVTLGRFDTLYLESAREAFHQFQLKGERPAAPTLACAITFGDLCTLFLTAKQGVYAESTLSALGYYLDTQLLPIFGCQVLSRLKTPEIADWFYRYSRTRPGGANQALGHFTTIVNWGSEAGHLPQDFRNPAAPIRFNKRRSRGRMLNSDQLRRLAAVLNSASQNRRDAADAIWLILLTGCRSGEILRLRWDEVKRGKLKLSRTKTGPRDVALNSTAIEHLEKLRKTRRSDYVFPSSKSHKPYRTSIDNAWRSLKELAELPPDIRLHDLRHTYASHAIMSGETLSMTGKLLGHKRPNSTERYAHLDQKYLERAANKVARKVAKLMEV